MAIGSAHIQKHQHRINPLKPYILLNQFNKKINAIPDAELWLKAMLETSSDSLETQHENMRHPWYVDIGGNSSLNGKDLKNTFPAFLLNLWREGISVDWKLWYAGTNYQKIALPSYPFVKTRYWLDSYKEKNTLIDSYLPYEGKKVILEIVRDHIAIIKMQDVEPIIYSPKKLLHGLKAKFKEAGQNDQVKVIILTGYENIFSMGGDEANYYCNCKWRR